MSSDNLTFQREGLPADYRMRHEEHYVDELVAAGSMPQLRLVPVREIEGAPHRGRSDLGAGSHSARSNNIDGLIDSIQAYGVLQPLLVRRHRGGYELLAGAKRLAAAVNAGLKEVPCLVHEVDDMEARRLAEAANRRAGHEPVPAATSVSHDEVSGLVESSLSTILSTLTLLERPDSSLRDRVAVGLIRAEALKAARTLRGLAILRAEPALTRRAIDAATIVENVVTAYDDERGLLGVELETSIPKECPIRADEELVRIAVAGAVETILAVVRESRGATVRVHLERNEHTSAVNLTVSEDAVRMPTVAWSRWFDPDWDDRPGGFSAGVSLLAARRAAELHNGRLELAPTTSGGCGLTVMFPFDAA